MRIADTPAGKTSFAWQIESSPWVTPRLPTGPVPFTRTTRGGERVSTTAPTAIVSAMPIASVTLTLLIALRLSGSQIVRLRHPEHSLKPSIRPSPGSVPIRPLAPMPGAVRERMLRSRSAKARALAGAVERWAQLSRRALRVGRLGDGSDDGQPSRPGSEHHRGVSRMDTADREERQRRVRRCVAHEAQAGRSTSRLGRGGVYG